MIYTIYAIPFLVLQTSNQALELQLLLVVGNTLILSARINYVKDRLL